MLGRFGFSRTAPFLYVFDKDVLFTSVMTFFHASIEMGRPPPPSECLPWFSPGRSRHEVSQGLYGVGFPGCSWRGFPRGFTAWAFPGHSRRVGTALQFRLSFGLHAATRSPLGLRTPVSPVEGARAGPRFTRKRARRRSTPGTWNSIRTTTYSSFPDQGKRLFQVCLHKRASYDRNRTETLE